MSPRRLNGAPSLPFPSLSDCLLANVAYSREAEPDGSKARWPDGFDLRRPVGGQKQINSPAKELLTWPPTDPQNMLERALVQVSRLLQLDFQSRPSQDSQAFQLSLDQRDRTHIQIGVALPSARPFFLSRFLFLKPERHF